MKNTNLTDDDAAFVRQFIAERRWQTSKPSRYYPQHQYTVRDWAGIVYPGVTDWSDIKDQEHVDFTRFVSILDMCGEPVAWGRKTYNYLYVDGTYYWHMFLAPEKTDLINRSLDKVEA